MVFRTWNCVVIGTMLVALGCGDNSGDGSTSTDDVGIADVGSVDDMESDITTPSEDNFADDAALNVDAGDHTDTSLSDSIATDVADDMSVVTDIMDTTADIGTDVTETESTLVGVTYIEVETDGGRVLPTAIWYPIPPGTTGTPEVYLNLIASGGALRDAPIASGGPWPLVLFSHGNQSLKEQSVFLTEFLALNGYIVAAPDHVWNTFFTYDESKLPLIAKERPKDITAVIDRLETPEAGDPEWFRSAIDFNHIGVSGHSFGGYTTLAVAGGELSVPQDIVALCKDDPGNLFCSVIDPNDPGPYDFGDPRVDCALPMAPGGKLAFGTDGLTKIGVPTMIMGGKKDTITSWQSEAVDVFDQLNAPAYLFGLENGEHFTFSDICEIVAILPAEQAQMFGTVCSPDAPLSMDVALALIQETALVFFDAYLKDDVKQAALLTKETMENKHSEIEFFVKESK